MQTPLILDWIKYSSTETTALGNAIANRKTSVALSPDGSIYICGTASASFDNQYYSGKEDAYLIKYSPSGVKLWTRIFGSAESDNAYSLIVGNDGSVFVTGYTASPYTDTSIPMGNAFVTKFSSNGVQMWNRYIATDKLEESLAIQKGLDDSLYVAGWMLGDIGDQKNSGQKDGFISKISSEGSVQWTKLIGSNLDDQANAITFSTNDAIYITGNTYGSIDGQQSLGRTDVFISKFNTKGEKLWTKLIGSTEWENSNAIAVGLDGSVYVAGSTNGSIDGQAIQGQTDMFITKISPGGDKQLS